MSESLIDFPDPLTYTGPEFEWSAEDRRVLAIIRLQGTMERYALRALAIIDPKAPSPSDLNKLHSLIDQAVESGKELSKAPFRRDRHPNRPRRRANRRYGRWPTVWAAAQFSKLWCRTAGNASRSISTASRHSG